jgi:hypothetical protein
MQRQIAARLELSLAGALGACLDLWWDINALDKGLDRRIHGACPVRPDPDAVRGAAWRWRGRLVCGAPCRARLALLLIAWP